ncbi:hypothetical protein Ciccas_006965, partial [Cichlidogyrus casuarinus]
AAGKPDSGISAGALAWLGSFDLCFQLNVDQKSPEIAKIGARYCRLDVGLGTTFGLPIIGNLGLCLPHACDTADLADLFNSSLCKFPVKTYFQALAKRGLKMVDSSICYKENPMYEVPKDNWFWSAIGIYAALLLMLIVGTLLEFIKYSSFQETSSVDQTNFDQSPFKQYLLKHRKVFLAKSSVLTRILLSFSVPNNITQLFELKAPQLTAHKLPSGEIHLPTIKTFKLWGNVGRSELILNQNGKQRSESEEQTVSMSDRESNHSFECPADNLVNLQEIRVRHPLSFLDGVRALSMFWIVFGHSIAMPLVFTCENRI